MLRSSREGRKRAAMYHAFPASHPSFSSRYSQKVGSMLHHGGRMTVSSQPQRTARPSHSTATHHHATIKSSSLRQATIESDSESESSSPQTALDDADDSTNGNSSYTTHTDPAADESATPVVEVSQVEGVIEANVENKVYHQRTTPSRETTEEQSQSVSLYNSSPPTSHSEGDDAILDTLKQWHENLEQLNEDAEDHLEGAWFANASLSPPHWEDSSVAQSASENQVQFTSLSPSPSHWDGQSVGPSTLDGQALSISLSPARWEEEEEEEDEVEADEEEEDVVLPTRRERIRSHKDYSRAPRVVEGGSMIDNRGHRKKVKSLKMKEAEETLALSPKSRRRVEARKSGLSKPTSSHTDDGEEGPTPSPTWSNYLAQGRIKRNERIEQVEQSEAVFARRDRSRPRGSNKERAMEKSRKKPLENRVSETSSSKKTSTASARTLKARKTAPEMQISTDSSLALSADSVFGSLSSDSILRRSSRRSDVAGGSTSAEDVVAETGKPATLRAPLPNPRTSKAAEVPFRSPRVSRFNESLDEWAKMKENVRVAGPSMNSAVEDGGEIGSKPAKVLSKRKVYLTSGLYSDDYKRDEPKAVLRRRSVKDVPESLARGTSRTRKAHHVSALPMPVDYGLHLLEQQRDFRLPFPVAQEIEEIRGKLEAKKKPPPYKHIAQNQYFSRPRLEGELLICQCPPDGNCGESCMNRLTECLCHPKHCPCGDRCTNIYFGKRKAVKTEVQWYGARGFGLKTLEPIKKGGFIDEYRGEVIDFNEAVRRIRDHYKDMGNYYFLMYDAPAGEMLDGGLKGNITRFANHSCDPNCKVQKWLVCGTGEPLENEYQVALFAERDIEAGEELTYDYGWSAFAAKAVSGESNSSTPEICHCGAAICSGFLGVKKSAATTASAVVSKVLKRAKRAKKAVVAATAESNKSNSAGPAALPESKSMPLPVVKTSSATKAFLASLRKSQSASPTKATTSIASPNKTTPSRVSTSGIMGRVLNGLFSSPSSTLTSPSSSSDDDVFELEKSADSTMTSYDSEARWRRHSLVQQGRHPNKRKRYSARGSSPIELSSAVASGSSRRQARLPSLMSKKSSSPMPKSTTLPKGRILLKDRVIRVLVPRVETEEESKPNLIVEGKRERKKTLRAIEQDHDLYNRRRMRSSSDARGASADSEAPATKKARRATEVQSSPTPRARLTSRATGP